LNSKNVASIFLSANYSWWNFVFILLSENIMNELCQSIWIFSKWISVEYNSSWNVISFYFWFCECLRKFDKEISFQISNTNYWSDKISLF
jgi:hypothetical protein